MRAAVPGKPGQVEIINFPEPTLSKGDILIAPRACGICATDVKFVKAGAEEPKYALGHEVAGVVIKTTPEATWKVGQQVVVAPYLPCGACYYCQHGQPALCKDLYKVSLQPGGIAEEVLVPKRLAEEGTFIVPQSIDMELASLAEPMGCAIKGIEDSLVKKGDTILVIGDGPMGLLSMAAGRAFGASKIIAAGMTPHRLDVAEKYYADVVINVENEDLNKRVLESTGSIGADVVIVAVSSLDAFNTGAACVRAGGVVNMFAGVPDGSIVNLDLRKLHYKQYYLTGSSGTAPSHMQKALDLMSSRKVDLAPIISARFTFEQTFAAVEYVRERIGLKSVVYFA
ncbi:MAG TPA: alcohol dehydrogenase catalytic domain-containing protein [Longilinea sp.]|nr:alcohol dehydrogenase catalytic domain-containing protein [Longilinea sp.]